MNIEDAKIMQCVRCNSNCIADRCMAWLHKSPEEPEDGQCAYMCVGTSLMKVLHIWSMMATQPRSKIVGG